MVQDGLYAECPMVQVFWQDLQGRLVPFILNLHCDKQLRRNTVSNGCKPAIVQIIKSMKRKNDSHLRQYGKEDLGFLDDRMQLLETVREIIDIELERREVNHGGDTHPENPPPEDRRRTPPDPPPRRTLWQRIVSLFTSCLP